MNNQNKIYIALVHFPVLDKNGAEIASAVTNLDVHDLARLVRAYGLTSLFIVTPDSRQKELVESVIKHWREGFGSFYNQDRKEALGMVKVVDSIERMKGEIVSIDGKKPLLVSTSASKMKNYLSFGELKRIMRSADGHFVILFGTAWGLGKSVIEQSDYMLEPIDMQEGYNHLSVRSAASIILDRLMN